MNVRDLQRKIIASARQMTPSEAVPYAFEKRIMARLRGEMMMDLGTFWAQALGRAAVPCLAVTLLLGVWNWMETQGNNPPNPLASSLEETVLAPFDQFGETW